MILVDTSVWIDYLRGASTPQAAELDALLGATPLAIGDLILAEVLQGCSTDRELNAVNRTLSSLELIHSDRDFDPFAQHLGLRCVGCAAWRLCASPPSPPIRRGS